MKDFFLVSVIIPIYNADRYLRNAVESATSLPEVGEVLLIEDKSPDNALKVCHELERQYTKVRVLQHPNGENRGAGESRNLGINNAKFDFVAFLDADDWYLPNRFHRSREIFRSESADGVYEATGYFYEETNQIDGAKLTTVAPGIDPNNLLYSLFLNGTGRFHTNAITLRKSIFKKSGLFNTNLRLHQDTELWLRLAFVGRLVPGNIKIPVAIRRVHTQNRIQHLNATSRKLLFIASFTWFEKQVGVDKRALRILFKRFVSAKHNGLPGRFLYSIFYFIRKPGRIIHYL